MPVKKPPSKIGLLIPTLLQGEVEGWRNTGWHGVTQTTSYQFKKRTRQIEEDAGMQPRRG